MIFYILYTYYMHVYIYVYIMYIYAYCLLAPSSCHILVGNLQSQATSLEGAVHEKVGSETLQQMKNQIGNLQSQVTAFDKV